MQPYGSPSNAHRHTAAQTDADTDRGHTYADDPFNPDSTPAGFPHSSPHSPDYDPHTDGHACSMSAHASAADANSAVRRYVSHGSIDDQTRH